MAKRLFVVAVIFTFAAAGIVGQSKATLHESLIGTWRLNAAQSKYNPGPAPKSQTLTWQRDGAGFIFTVDTVTAEGKPTKSFTRGNFDGKPYAVEGSATKAVRTFQRIDDFTYEDSDSVDGKVTVSRRVVLSKDGKTLTVTVKGTNAQGKPTSNLTVFEKQ